MLRCQVSHRSIPTSCRAKKLLGPSKTLACILVLLKVKAGCLIGSDFFSNPRRHSLVVHDQDAFLPASGQCCRFTAVNRLDHGMWVGEAHAELSAWNAHACAAK